MKRFKKPKKNHTLTPAEIKDIGDRSVGMAALLYMTAMKDEFDMSMEDLTKIFVRASRYAEYLDAKLVDMQNIADDLYKSTGIKITWR